MDEGRKGVIGIMPATLTRPAPVNTGLSDGSLSGRLPAMTTSQVPNIRFEDRKILKLLQHLAELQERLVKVPREERLAS